jgi:hypothetical protein
MRRGVIVTTWLKKDVDKKEARDSPKRHASTGRRSSPNLEATSGTSTPPRAKRELRDSGKEVSGGSGGRGDSSDSPRDSGSPRSDSGSLSNSGKALVELPARTDSFGSKITSRNSHTKNTNNANFDPSKITGDDTLPNPVIVERGDNSRNADDDEQTATNDLVAALKSNRARNNSDNEGRVGLRKSVNGKKKLTSSASSPRAKTTGIDSPAPEREDSKDLVG